MKKKKNTKNIKKEKNIDNIEKTGNLKDNEIISNKSLSDIKKLEKKNDLKKEESLTKQQYFNFETNNIELDDIKKSKKKSSRKQKIVVVEKKVYPKFLLFILITINLCLIMLMIYHFKTFNHNEVKTVTNTKKIVIKENVDNNYLFLGDSITNRYNLDKYYKNTPVVNSGIGGNQTTDILDDMNNRAYIYNPTKVFLLIGTNDIAIDRTNEEIVNNIEKIIKGIKKNRQSCKIYLESIYPINSTDNEKINHGIVGPRTNKRIKEINSELEELSKKLNITYIDMYSELVDDNGNLKIEYTTEGLHLTDEGYEKVTGILMKYIDN